MKTKLGLYSSALCLLLLVGCGNGDKTPVATLYGSTTINEAIDIKYSEFSSMMDDKMSFILTQYPENHCYCWSSFRDNVLYPYIEASHLITYQIGFSAFNVQGRNQYGIDAREDRPSVYIIEDGVVKYSAMYSGDSQIFHDYNAFKGWIEEFVYKPNVFYVTESELENLFKGTDNFIIYYSWSVCPDCSYLQKNHLEEYFRDIKAEYPTIYAIDCYQEGIMLNKNGEYDRALYETFIAKYNLSAETNSRYGYRTGVVPTLQYVEPNGTFNPNESIKSSYVYVNDVITFSNNKYIVTESFFSQERLQYLPYLNNVENNVIQGITLTADEVNVGANNENIKWKYEKSAQWYNPLFDAFMNYYKNKI